MQFETNRQLGIVGQRAPELRVPTWYDENGQKRSPVELPDKLGRPAILYCFQSWCPGCHSRGFPTLAQLIETCGDQVDYYAIQTVFEGFAENTEAKVLEAQRHYGLRIPFGHDPGQPRQLPATMADYRTGGTPWIIAIAADRTVVANGFHLNVQDVAAKLNPHISSRS
jgi:thiol-disulfide isomerase/thioredoxin